MIDFSDAILATLTILRPEFPGVTFGFKTPDQYPKGEEPDPPYVSVQQATSRINLRLDERATLRILCYADDGPTTNMLARRIRAFLLNYRGGSEVRAYNNAIGPRSLGNTSLYGTTASDPDTGLPLASLDIDAFLIALES